MHDLQKLLNHRMTAEYAEIAVLPHAAGEEMLLRLDLVTLQPRVIAELGSSDGYLTALLTTRYPDARIISIKDAEAVKALPFADESVDLLIANFLLPWCEDLTATWQEWQRILRPEGLLMFTTLGPDTLKELQPIPLQFPYFVDMHNIGDGLTQAGFADPVLDVEYFTLTYRDHAQFIHELQLLGMISGPLEQMNWEPDQAGVFSVTFEMVYGHAWRVQTSHEYRADEQGVVHIPLKNLRKK